jgi:hypothetical protein
MPADIQNAEMTSTQKAKRRSILRRFAFFARTLSDQRRVLGIGLVYLRFDCPSLLIGSGGGQHAAKLAAFLITLSASIYLSIAFSHKPFLL